MTLLPSERDARSPSDLPNQEKNKKKEERRTRYQVHFHVVEAPSEEENTGLEGHAEEE